MMQDRQLQELRGDLHDLYDAIGGLGIELEARNMSVRALAAHLIGEDPLRDSLYYGAPVEEGAAPEPPPWVNGIVDPPSTTRPAPSRGRMGSAAAIVVVSATVALVTTLAILYILIT